VIVCNQAGEAYLDLILAVGYTLRLHKNDVYSGRTTAQLRALTQTDFVEATFPGYAAVPIAGGAWTTTPGDPGVGSFAQQAFIRSSTGSTELVYGWYLTTTTGGFLRNFDQIGGAGGISMRFINDEIRVTPRITLSDDEDETS
jgi:hypothetical protein